MNLAVRLAVSNQGNPKPPDAPSGGGGGDEMDTRLTRIETRVETILPTLATKADVATAESGIVKWLSAIFIGLLSIAVAVMLFAINRITPPQSPQAVAPIIVYPQAPGAPQLPQQRAK